MWDFLEIASLAMSLVFRQIGRNVILIIYRSSL